MEIYFIKNDELKASATVVIDRKYSNAELIKRHKGAPQWVQDFVKDKLRPKKESKSKN